MGDKNADAIGDILKVRDQLVVMRERLFQLTGHGRPDEEGRWPLDGLRGRRSRVRGADRSAELGQRARHAGPSVHSLA